MIVHPLLRIALGLIGVILFVVFTPIIDLCEIALQVVLLPLLFLICILGVGEGVYAMSRDLLRAGLWDRARASLTAARDGLKNQADQPQTA